MIAIDFKQLTNEIESILASGTRLPGLRGRVMIDTRRLNDVSEGLRTSIPSNILEAQEILNQKDSILNQVHLEAQRIQDEAVQQVQQMKDETTQQVQRMKDEAVEQVQQMQESARLEQESKVAESTIVKEAESKAHDINHNAAQDAQQIMQDAQQRAFRIVDEAETAANERRVGGDQYARETLFNLEERMASLLGQVRRGIDSLATETEPKVPV